MKNAEIENDKYFKKYIRSRGIRKSTKRVYITRIKTYTNFTGKTPTQLIKEADKEQDKGIKRYNRKINDYILDYVDYCKENDKAIQTIKLNIDTINSFYKYFDIDPPTIRGLLKKDPENLSFEKLPEMQTIEHALTVCKPRERAILLLQLSSGMGSAEIRSLTCKHFIDAFSEYIDLDRYDKKNLLKVATHLKDKNEEMIGTWKIVRIKTGMPYITFNSPESSRALINYVLYRYEMNKHIKSLDRPFFVNQFNRAVNKEAMTRMYNRINDNSGLGYRNNKRRTLTSHIPRKIFTTNLYRAGLDKLAIDWMLGHKINEVTESYFKTNIQDLKKLYMNAVEYLTIEKVKIKRVAAKEIKDIVRELDTVKHENILLNEINNRNEERLDKVEQRNKEIIETVDKSKPYLDLMMNDSVIQKRLKKLLNDD